VPLLQGAADGKQVHEVHRKDYSIPPYTCSTLQLHFSLGEDVSHVNAKMQLEPATPPTDAPAAPLVLDGRSDVKLLFLKLNGQAVAESSYTLTASTLTLTSPPREAFELEVGTELRPQDNTLLEGLYKSSGTFCTQVCPVLPMLPHQGTTHRQPA
jgi:aminopeptidase N